MNKNVIQECNQKCRVKHAHLAEEKLIQKILAIQEEKNVEFKDRITEDRLRNSFLKEGLIKELCIIECGLIETGWGS